MTLRGPPALPVRHHQNDQRMIKMIAASRFRRMLNHHAVVTNANLVTYRAATEAVTYNDQRGRHDDNATDGSASSAIRKGIRTAWEMAGQDR